MSRDDGYCCKAPDCCGPGSWCCQRAGAHEHPEMDYLALQAELDELERTDPEVAAAAASYDEMVRRVTAVPFNPDPNLIKYVRKTGP